MTFPDNLGIEAFASVPDKPETPITREGLYALVWSEPMLKVALRFDVSSSYMARVCTRMNVPRPERGYWARLAVGQAPRLAPLPEARPGDLLIWSRDGSDLLTAQPIPRPPETRERRQRVSKHPSSESHPLVTGAKPLFEAGRLSYGVGYLKPAKRLLVDLSVTKDALDKALSLANQLFLSLEAHGHRVALASNGEHLRRVATDEREKPSKHYLHNNLWSPGRCTVVYLGTVAIGLTILEMSEEVAARYVDGKYIRESDYVPPKRGRYVVDGTWTTTKTFPTGRLCLHAYSPYARAEWQKQWRESTGIALADLVPRIIKELELAAVEVAKLAEEGARQAEIERQQWEEQRAIWQREEEERRLAKALKDSKDDLLQLIEMWSGSKRLEAFFEDAERRLSALPDEERRLMTERLERARKLIGSVDALERFQHWKAPEDR